MVRVEGQIISRLVEVAPGPPTAAPAGAARRRTLLDVAIIGLSVAGVPIGVFALRRLGRLGGLLLEIAAAALGARAVTMLVAGVAHRLRVLPQVLLVAEAAVDCLAAGTGFCAWVWRPLVHPALMRCAKHASTVVPLRQAAQEWPRASATGASWVTPVAVGAWMTALILHTARVAIYISPGRGLRHVAAERNGRPTRSSLRAPGARTSS
jgi:hypothetical protein